MNIFIREDSSLPIYEQIVSAVKTSILNHEIAPGDMLPSIRSLAKDLGISVITTKRAYEELEKLGLIIRERDPDCRRAYQISLTAAGQEKAEQIEQAFQKLADQMCEGISGEKMGLLTGELLKMIENLNRMTENR